MYVKCTLKYKNYTCRSTCTICKAYMQDNQFPCSTNQKKHIYTRSIKTIAVFKSKTVYNTIAGIQYLSITIKKNKNKSALVQCIPSTCTHTYKHARLCTLCLICAPRIVYTAHKYQACDLSGVSERIVGATYTKYCEQKSRLNIESTPTIIE